MSKILEVGDVAPDFSGLDENGDTLINKILLGKKIILYFYPKDNTPGCTVEAIDFTSVLNDLLQLNCIVVGVSGDSVSCHKKFIQKHSLGVKLISDSKFQICSSYGAMKEKSIFGNSFLGITRSTFVIDEYGLIRAIWRNVKVPGHVKEVTKFIETL